MQGGDRKEQLSLSQATEYLLQECRTVLPGIQALFGFQLVAVFNNGFSEALSAGQQRLHLFAISVVAIAVAIIMTPAAYHRQTGLYEVSDHFVRLSTRLILWSMLPLAVGICVDFYLIAALILGGSAAPLAAAALFAVFVLFWFVLPRARGLRRLIGGYR